MAVWRRQPKHIVSQFRKQYFERLAGVQQSRGDSHNAYMTSKKQKAQSDDWAKCLILWGG